MKELIKLTITMLLVSLWMPLLAEASQPATKEDIQMLIKLNQQSNEQLNKRIDDVNAGLNKRIDDVNKRIDDLRVTMFWLFGTFITLNIAILGFIIKLQWQMHRRLQIVETTLETQKDEMNFLKSLIEKLIISRDLKQSA